MIHLLQGPLTAADASSYLPVGMQVIIAVGLVAFLLFATHMLGPKRRTSDKLQSFASGIESHGDARQPMAIKYFLTAILFVLFDVEVIFFLSLCSQLQGPWLERFLGCNNVCELLFMRLYIYNKKRRIKVGGLR